MTHLHDRPIAASPTPAPGGRGPIPGLRGGGPTLPFGSGDVRIDLADSLSASGSSGSSGSGAGAVSRGGDSPREGVTEERAGRLKRISDGIAGLHKQQFGRGPGRCRTFLAGADTAVCLVDATLGVSEQRLVELGEGERVRTARLLVLDAAQDELKAIVEEILGREVRVVIAGVDVRHDVVGLTFVLGQPTPGR